MIGAVYIGCVYAVLIWQFTYCARWVLKWMGRTSPKPINWVFFEFRPFVPAGLAVAFVTGGMANDGNYAGMRLFNLIVGMVGWLLARWDKDDDDRWNKRRQAVADRVANVGHKLVVVRAEQ